MQPLITPQFQTAPTSTLLSHQRHRGTEDMSTHSDAWTQQDTNCLGLPLYNPCSVLGEPQNHRMVEVERDLWRSSGPNPLIQKGHPQSTAQDTSRWLLNISRHGDSTILGNLCPCSVTFTVKEMSPDVQKEPAVCHCVPTGSWHVTGHH